MGKMGMTAVACAAGILTGLRCMAAEPTARTRTLTMMSFNVRIGCGLRDPFWLPKGSLGHLPKCAEVIRKVDPDWVAVQEIDRCSDRAGGMDQTAELAKLCGMKGCFVKKVSKPGGDYGLAILSKEEPLSVSKVLMPGVSHTRCLEIVEFRDYVVACTHYPLAADFRDRASEIVRVNLAERGKPVFLAGDFNATPDSRAIEILKKDFTILSDTERPTFPADAPTTCIDYIMVDTAHADRVTVASRQVIAAPEATDHCALAVTVDLKALASSAIPSVCGADVFLEAERFEDLGGWAVDAQFIDQMGSTFLLAHGMGRPVADATATFDCPAAGTYHVWARTRNWTAPWSEHAAGTFTIRVNGRELPNVLGRGTGDWQWQKAGEATIPPGRATIALHDLTGFDGRCDAICLTPHDRAVRPPPSCDGIVARRVKADLVVCGGGIAGTCAAISAARLGLKVALVQDRPMLGGANSSEVRVHLGGYMNLGPYPRLGDVVAEIGPAKGGNAQSAERYEDRRKLDAVVAEKNISLFLNTRVRWVEKKDGRIVSVRGQDVITGTRTEFEAPLFADCTGDGCVGALAGADFRMGRESRAETGEDMAPEVADRMTMGASVQWYTKDDAEPSEFPVLPWMIAFNEQNCEYGTRGDWDWETGMMRDPIVEFERIRDYGMLVAYSNWAFLKSRSARREAYARRSFAWVAYVAGKRESRRLLGDHILTQQDVFDLTPYPDGTCCTTWAIDLHYPMPKNVRHYDGEPFRSICTHNRHYAYPIPYRCLYSRNVPNLFMAGRNVSVTHVALGTTRVMRTTGMMGEVVGMAARVCKDRGCLPRGVYADHLGDLKALMARGVGTGRPQPPQDYNLGALKPGMPGN